MRPVVILRPEPGATQTEERARRHGLATVRFPLFDGRAVAWDPPAADAFDALLVTSAYTARLGGAALARYRTLPAYAVGQPTARALEAQGFDGVVAGEGDGSAIAARIAADGHRQVLHLGGRTVAAMEAGPLSIHHVVVYEMVGRDSADPDAGFEPGAVLLVHSPRAGERLATMVAPESRSSFHVIAISPNALAACGEGWASSQAASEPDDETMLALALRLCE